MKKILCLILMLAILSTLFVISASAYETQTISVLENYAKIIINDENANIKNFVSDGTTYIGLRNAANAFGYKVEWNADKKAAVLTSGETPTLIMTAPVAPASSPTEINVLVNFADIYIDGTNVTARNFDYDGTLYLSLRDIGTLFGYAVEWDDTTKTARLTKLMIEDTSYCKINETTIPFNIVKVVAQNSYLASTSADDAQEAVINTAKQYAFFNEMAKQYNVTITADDIVNMNMSFEDYVNTYAGGKDFLTLILKNSGITMEQYADYFREIYGSELLVSKIIEQINTNPNTAKAEERSLYSEYYNNNPDMFAIKTVRVKHILVETEEEAKQIQNKLKQNVSFETLIRDNNNDPGMPEEGYYVYENSGMVKEFESAALSLNKGQVSTPVKTNYGYHIIKAYETFDKVPFNVYYSPSNFSAESYVRLKLTLWVESAKTDINLPVKFAF